MARKLYTYSVGPIDIWGLFQNPEDVLEIEETGEKILLGEYTEMLAAGMAEATQLGWEGDLVRGPLVSILPEPGSAGLLIIAWKQSNNGSTYVVSRVELPYLKHHSIDENRESEY